MMSMRCCRPLFLLLLPVVLIAQTPAKTIPSFNFYTLSNASFVNSNLPANKKIFFVFFDTGCEHCQRSVARFNQHSSELRNAAVYFITLDPKGKIDPFMSKYGSNLSKEKNITILQDRQFQFIPKFQPKKYPSMFLYSAKQQLILYSDDEASVDKFIGMIKGGK